MDDEQDENSTTIQIEENFLRSCRNGDLGTVKQFLAYLDAGKVDFNISCKGQTKYLGWTPLHLATYFGHRDVVECLLTRNVDVDAINENGDTALHKASFIGREDLVMLLLQHNADVYIINGDGRLPRDVTQDNAAGREINELLRAAEATEVRRLEGKLLTAARDGDLDLLNRLLKDQQHPPNINCVDSQGNSCLHCASYRGHKETAVLLLQNGIDTGIRNKAGKTALDLARDEQMTQILTVKSVRKVQRSATRMEGPLLKRSRFLGWRPVWAVLERGVLSYYQSRADSTANNKNKRRDYKYLDSARVSAMPTLASFVVHFNDGSFHRLSVVSTDEKAQVQRQKWINAFQEHAAYSSHYLWGIDKRRSDSEDECADVKAKPLGCMNDALSSASASFEVLQRQLSDCVNAVDMLQKTIKPSKSLASSTSSASVTTLMHFQMISETAANMVASLHHCLTLFHQQEDVRVLQLKEEREKCRVLEESLNVLAKEHHQLEMSVAEHISETGHIPKSLMSEHDEYHDAFGENGEESDSDDTLVTASVFNSPSESMHDLNSIPVAPYEKLSFHESYKSAMAAATGSCARSSLSPSSDEEDDVSDDTLVDGVSIVSSSTTYISEGGDVYKCAKGDFLHSRDKNKLHDVRVVNDLIDVEYDEGAIGCGSQMSELPRMATVGR